MPDVRLAATGMDSCPASDEDTEDELEASQNRSRARFLLPSTSRQLVNLKYYVNNTCISCSFKDSYLDKQGCKKRFCRD